MNNFKKAVAVILAASSVAAYAVTASASNFEKGDADRDNTVGAMDALITLRASVGLYDLDEEQRELADFDEDGIVTANDALGILRYSIGYNGSGDNNDVPDENYSDPDMVDTVSLVVDPDTIEYPAEKTYTQVAEMKGWAPADVVAKVGPLFTEDQRNTGILASVSLAQFIVESGYGQSRLSLEANNCFGIKGYPGQGTWYGSAWDGVSVYNINTGEQNPDGSTYVVYDSFRMYDCMEDSITDHSAYLCTSMNGNSLRYEGIVGCKDYRQAAQIIKDGGYATAVNYVDVICSVIENWNLTQYDLSDDGSYVVPVQPVKVQDTKTETSPLYRVRLSWNDWNSQIGAYRVLDNAIAKVNENPGYSVFDEDGNVVY